MKLKNKYLIGLDLDGTLLNDSQKICLKTKLYLRHLSKEGHLIVLSSGRPLRAMIDYYKDLKLDSPMISINGALVNFNKNRIHDTYLIKKEKIIELIKIINKDNNVSIMCETIDTIFTNDLVTFDFLLFNKDKSMTIKYGEVDKILDRDTFTFIIKYDGSQSMKKLIEESISGQDDLYFRFWGDYSFVELTYKKCSKYQALHEIAQNHSIDMNHIYVFGDANNDIEMLSHFKNGVCMANANERIKQCSKFVTKKDNNHNGIYYFLKNNLK